jgi:hypothetical protein
MVHRYVVLVLYGNRSGPSDIRVRAASRKWAGMIGWGRAMALLCREGYGKQITNNQLIGNEVNPETLRVRRSAMIKWRKQPHIRVSTHARRGRIIIHQHVSSGSHSAGDDAK